MRKNRRMSLKLAVIAGLVGAAGWLHLTAASDAQKATVQEVLSPARAAKDLQVDLEALDLLHQGRETFRHSTFNDQLFWSRTLKLHRVVTGVPPLAALELGLKVDAAAVPAQVLATADLRDPATTVALLQLDAVVGIRAVTSDLPQWQSNGGIRTIGITCALCHSTVDDSVAPGIGQRLDGWANRDLNVGAIIALSPGLKALADVLGVDVDTARAVLQGWGPGKFDAHLLIDGRGLRPDGASGAVLIPPAFGLAGINLATYTGWGSVAYWNALVANHEMNGLGTFFDPRLDDAEQFPVAAAVELGDTVDDLDSITSQLPALHFYQLALSAPAAPEDSFDAAAAARGEALFNGRATCSTCHVPPLYTEPGWALHTPEEIGIDDFQASRSPTGRYRTTPLKGLWTHQKGGFYHDGRFADWLDVVEHYDAHFELGLEESEKLDLIEFLKSL